MNNSHYEYILKECKMRCPLISNNIDHWYPYSEDAIIVVRTDGGAVHYDNIFKCYTYKESVDELESFLDFDESKYYRENDYKQAWSLNFAKKLYVKMIKASVNQVELADRTGLSQASIAGYVNGIKMPTIYNAKKIADTLNCTLNDLVDF